MEQNNEKKEKASDKLIKKFQEIREEAILARKEQIFSLLNKGLLQSPYKLSDNSIREILFIKSDDHYIFDLKLLPIRTKIDYSNVSFDNVDLSTFDFTGMIGVKINPQTIYNKNLTNTILNGVEFIGEGDIFKDVKIRWTSFKDSRGAKINPQTICDKDLTGCVLRDVVFYQSDDSMNIIDFFKNVGVEFASFEGSKGAIINPQTVKNKDFYHTQLSDVIIMDVFNPKQDKDLFEGVKLENTNFTGSRNVRINPQTIYKKNLHGCILKDVKFVGPFDKINICNCDFSGSKGAVVDLSKIKVANFTLYGVNFSNAKLIGTTRNNIWRTRNVTLTGCTCKIKQKLSIFVTNNH